MIVGVPGVGINGAFYLLLAVLMPVRQLWRTIKGRGVAGQWKKVLFLFSLAVGMFFVLWVEYRILEHIVAFLMKHTAGPETRSTKIAECVASVAPHLTYVPIILLAGVMGGIHLLRLALWIASKWTRRGMAALLLVGLVLFGLVGCLKTLDPVAVYPPPGYHFGSAPPSIRAEHDALDDFYQSYFDNMTGSLERDTYGLALANQVIGLIRNDPAYIVRARTLFARHCDATDNLKEKRLADLGAKYAECLLTGRFPKATDELRPVEGVRYVKDLPPTGRVHRIILGRSVIHVTRNTLIKTQVDRVTRDWLMAFRVKGEPWDYEEADHFDSHEGAKLTELVKYTGARVVPVWGMMATKIGGRG